jgi:hypothetical protein
MTVGYCARWGNRGLRRWASPVPKQRQPAHTTPPYIASAYTVTERSPNAMGDGVTGQAVQVTGRGKWAHHDDLGSERQPPTTR